MHPYSGISSLMLRLTGLQLLHLKNPALFTLDDMKDYKSSEVHRFVTSVEVDIILTV